jgi:CRISPR-associated protein Csm2
MNDNIVEKIKEGIPAILEGNIEKLDSYAEELGRHLAKGVSTSQIRNIFSDVKRIVSYEKNKTELILLKPKLAYVAGRHGKRRGNALVGPIVDLSEVLSECIKKVHDDASLTNFKRFFEAILAYHRYCGGKE